MKGSEAIGLGRYSCKFFSSNCLTCLNSEHMTLIIHYGLFLRIQEPDWMNLLSFCLYLHI